MPATDSFVYLDSMQELANWQPEDSLRHAVNISNTPLCPRPLHLPPPAAGDTRIPSLLLCHDYRGGYHPSEAAQGLFATSDEEDPYTAEYLHLASIFIYFSHHRVSIPPAAWINACHRAGVKVLGTLLFEHEAARADAGRLLERGSEGEFLFATQLGRVADTYGFDGWLVNIEVAFPREKWGVGELQRMLREIPGMVIWYDALSVLNRVHYQNGLTLLNAPFLAACEGLFTNYWWQAPQLVGTKAVAAAMGRGGGVFMGVDCYGRGSLGGGGFGVREALEEVRKMKLQAAMFAPGWTWENFGGRDFREVERRFWGVVEKSVLPHSVGTIQAFYTCFNRGFGTGLWLRGKKIADERWVHLGAQSLLPHFRPSSGEAATVSWALDGSRAWTGAWSLKLSLTTTPRIRTEGSTHFQPLYSLGLTFSFSMVLRYAFQTTAALGSGVVAGLFWDFLLPNGERERRLEAFDGPCAGWKTGTVLVGDDDVESGVIVELGVFYTPSPASPSQAEIWIGELLITTLDDDEDEKKSTISSVVVREAVDGSTKRKLTWSVYPTYDTGRGKKIGFWSAQTKDFAYFLVWKGTQLRGVAYACEFVIVGEDDGEGWRVDGVTWEGAMLEGPKIPR